MILDIRNLSKTYPGQSQAAVSELSLNVEAGEIVALLGPSGCGKTTCLRLLAGFEQADEGQVFLEGQSMLELAPEKRNIGLVFQDYALFPHLTVLENVCFALKRFPRRERKEKALEYLQSVGLKDYPQRFPAELSGGQQQRVALARALAARPRLILLDEPFSNLDAALRDYTRQEVRRILKASNTSAILVTHDQEEALSFADRIAVMRSGHLVQIGRPEELYHFPRTPFVACFLGRTNLIRGTAHGALASTSLGELKLHCEAAGQVLLSLRPEHLSLRSISAKSPDRAPEIEQSALVKSREFRGHDITYRVNQNGHDYLVHTDYSCMCQPGDRVELVQRESAMVLEN